MTSVVRENPEGVLSEAQKRQVDDGQDAARLRRER